MFTTLNHQKFNSKSVPQHMGTVFESCLDHFKVKSHVFFSGNDYFFAPLGGLPDPKHSGIPYISQSYQKDMVTTLKP